jgi:hypothetical protein
VTKNEKISAVPFAITINGRQRHSSLRQLNGKGTSFTRADTSPKTNRASAPEGIAQVRAPLSRSPRAPCNNPAATSASTAEK